MLSRFVFLIVLFLWVSASIALAQQQKKADTLAFSSYKVVYDYTLNIPVYVCWSVSSHDLGNVKRNSGWRFKQDSRLQKPRVSTADYRLSGYQRGHMCPAADRSYSKEAMKETFTTANICPQAPSLNVGAWKQTEDQTRQLATILGKVHVKCAPIFTHADTTRIGKHRVAVPHGFIKVVYLADSITPIFCRLFTNE